MDRVVVPPVEVDEARRVVHVLGIEAERVAVPERPRRDERPPERRVVVVRGGLARQGVDEFGDVLVRIVRVEVGRSVRDRREGARRDGFRRVPQEAVRHAVRRPRDAEVAVVEEGHDPVGHAADRLHVPDAPPHVVVGHQQDFVTAGPANGAVLRIPFDRPASRRSLDHGLVSVRVVGEDLRRLRHVDAVRDRRDEVAPRLPRDRPPEVPADIPGGEVRPRDAQPREGESVRTDGREPSERVVAVGRAVHGGEPPAAVVRPNNRNPVLRLVRHRAERIVGEAVRRNPVRHRRDKPPRTVASNSAA